MKKLLLSILVLSIGFPLFSQEERGLTFQNEKKDTLVIKTYTIPGRESMGYKPVTLPIALKSEVIDSIAVKKILADGIEQTEYEPVRVLTFPANLPFLRSYTQDGVIASLGAAAIVGGSSYDEKPFLLVAKGASIGINKRYDNLYIGVRASATNYGLSLGAMYQFGISGLMTYSFSDNVSVTVFGQLYNREPFISPAAYPFVNTSRYGGFISIADNNDRVGVDLGAQQYFDPYRGKWVAAPIVTPKVRLGDNVWISVPVGGLIQNQIDRAHMRNTPPPPPPAPKRHR